MENKAIIKLSTFEMSWKELKELPEDQLALLGLLNYATTELNVLQRVYLACKHPFCEDDYLNAAIASQRYTILRVWSAKLFELMEAMRALNSPQKCIDGTVLAIADKATEGMQELLDDKAFPLVRNLRNEAISHYDFKAIKKNIEHVSPKANCNLYLHELDGNSYYPLGEELVFAGRVNRFGANAQSDEEKLKILGDWLDWNLCANKWVRETHVLAWRGIVEPRFPDRFGWTKSYYVPLALVGEIEPPTVPLFMRKAG